MTEMEIATAGRRIVFNAGAIEQLRRGLRGAFLLQGEGGYDAARKIYNAMIDHRPTAIARCAGAADVICSVNFARDNGLLVSVRGGGHNVSGNAVSDGGLMIDLSPMKSIRVDLQTRTVRPVIFVSYNGALEAGERILKPLRAFGPPLADMIGHALRKGTTDDGRCVSRRSAKLLEIKLPERSRCGSHSRYC